MPILKWTTNVTGLVGVLPRLIYLQTNDTLAEVQATGYLNDAVELGLSVSENDAVLVTTKTSPTATPTAVSLMRIVKSGANTSLTSLAGAGSMSLPTIANRIAVFTDTTGGLGDDAATAINAGNIQAGLSGTAGTLASFPATASRGSLILAGVANTGNTNVTISNAAHAQATVYSIPDVGAATGQFNVVTGALVNGNLMSASGTAGRLADSGIASSNVQLRTQIKAAQSANIGGAGAGPLNIAVTGVTISSVAVATVVSSSNAVQVQTVVPSADNLAVTLSGDPGASCIVSYIVYLAPQ